MKFEFDGTEVELTPLRVTVTEAEVTLTLWAKNLHKGWVEDAAWNTDGMVKAGSCSQWQAQRIVYCFGLAARRLARGGFVPTHEVRLVSDEFVLSSVPVMDTAEGYVNAKGKVIVPDPVYHRLVETGGAL